MGCGVILTDQEAAMSEKCLFCGTEIPDGETACQECEKEEMPLWKSFVTEGDTEIKDEDWDFGDEDDDMEDEDWGFDDADDNIDDDEPHSYFWPQQKDWLYDCHGLNRPCSYCPDFDRCYIVQQD